MTLSGHYLSSTFDKNTHDVSETGVCIRHQVKDIILLGPVDRASPYLRTTDGQVMEHKEEKDKHILYVEDK
jgi:hypothetical protein